MRFTANSYFYLARLARWSSRCSGLHEDAISFYVAPLMPHEEITSIHPKACDRHVIRSRCKLVSRQVFTHSRPQPPLKKQNATYKLIASLPEAMVVPSQHLLCHLQIYISYPSHCHSRLSYFLDHRISCSARTNNST